MPNFAMYVVLIRPLQYRNQMLKEIARLSLELLFINSQLSYFLTKVFLNESCH